MEINEIRETVKEFLIDELEIDESRIYDDARLKEDMGIDSLEVVDVVVLVDKKFGVRMKNEDFKLVKTFGQFCSFIAEKLS
ncbi:MAG: phosphopantetheine-binding protein [Bacteroidales bacterium]|nr:phosphopantetheine-binding protein [Bacteroidales bacterium]